MAWFKQNYCASVGIDNTWDIDTYGREYDDDHSSKGEIFDEDEFVSFSDAHGSDSDIEE